MLFSRFLRQGGSTRGEKSRPPHLQAYVILLLDDYHFKRKILLPDSSSQAPKGEAHWPGMDHINNQNPNHCDSVEGRCPHRNNPSELHGLSLRGPSAVWQGNELWLVLVLAWFPQKRGETRQTIEKVACALYNPGVKKKKSPLCLE